ncbi:hypothetical protein NBH00_17995 [Paraconexibacter antarcticus]|nr:hypothetical protein [Paraconexibacter antarcticus]UTI63242.1 hypothetical protein NBH00_17995 [Paraconexibacter antarcticus]
MLRRRLDLTAPVIGRIRLDDAVIALLVLDRGSTTTPRADRPFAQQIADLTSTAIARIRQSFFTDLTDTQPPLNHHTDSPLRATALA